MISFFVRTFIYIKKSNINRRLKVQFLYHLFYENKSDKQNDFGF